MARGKSSGRKAPRSTRLKAAYTLEPQQDVWSDLLAEAAQDEANNNVPDRPLKRRKTALKTQPVGSSHEDTTSDGAQNPQVIYDDSPSEDSDVDWQDVSFQQEQGNTTDEEPSTADIAATKDISVVIRKNETTPRKRLQTSRLPSSAIEKKKRLEVHKLHLCCLIAHSYVRSTWCCDPNVQAAIKPLLSKKTISYLNPNPIFSQFQRSRSFMDGLQQASEAFRPVFRTTERGFRRARWVTDLSALDQLTSSHDSESPLAKNDFVRLARKREGSRDTGAQLFCAMLRAAGVDARLVCSLQPLSFTSVPSPSTPQKRKPVVYASAESDHHYETGNESAASMLSARSVASSAPSPTVAKPIKRFGQSSGSGKAVDLGRAPPTPIKRVKLVESHYPVYWVEAFNVATQKWIAVDPLVTQTIDKPQKFEPPASDSLNDMTYVLAFEADGSARDVTKRYAKAYNAKTRRSRVESTKNGETWWRRVLKVFRMKGKDRDQIEDAEFGKKEAAEPMPRNVQDFKDHPYYALERHLRQNEVIHPKREVGKLNAGKGAKAVEPIYRRRDVITVRTADKWFRTLGREVKPGEQPLKYATPRRGKRGRSPSTDPDSDADIENPHGAALYGEFQTQPFVPKPVIDDRIPKNAFGNLDVYVPTMIPPGGAHIRAAEAATAAKILEIDYADAVTGFEFKGRRGTAVVAGVVLARNHAEAVEEVIRGLRLEKERERDRKRSAEALRLWKRFLLGLKVRERIMGYANEDEDKDAIDIKAKVDEVEDEEEQVVEEGGFLPDADTETAQPTAGIEAQDFATTSGVGAGAFASLSVPEIADDMTRADSLGDIISVIYSPWDFDGPLAALYRTLRPDAAQEVAPHSSSNKGKQKAKLVDGDEGGGFVASDHENGGGGFLVSDHEDGGGGFLASDHEDGGGGFLASDYEDGTEAFHTADEGGGFMTADEEGDGHSGSGGVVHENDDEQVGGGFTNAEVENNAGGGFISTPEHMADNPVTEDGKNGGQKEEIHAEATGISQPVEGAGDKHINKEYERNVVESEDTDNDSLLSEDPEDVDAEPDWIQ